MGALLTKEQMLAADDIKSERVEVPEWGGDVMVRGLTGTQRDAWEASMSVRRRQDDGPRYAELPGAAGGPVRRG